MIRRLFVVLWLTVPVAFISHEFDGFNGYAETLWIYAVTAFILLSAQYLFTGSYNPLSLIRR